jgi:BirA family biotin operon repressor/biotin-[acetyl-CoA-carboxylase] ligase
MMISLDADAIRRYASDPVRERLASLDVFSEIDSTNSYLMQTTGPKPGMISIAATSNQTAGRGRHGKSWESPPGSGLCLSVAYTFAAQPGNLPALTLALGLGAVAALQELGAAGLEIKWPNDLMARDAKLGGILTEVQQNSRGAVTIVAGIGINVDLQNKLDLGRSVVDLKSICDVTPAHEEIAGKIATHLLGAYIEFEEQGFEAVVSQWSQYDWLRGREITVHTADRPLSGIAAGIADDGALLVDTAESGTQRISSGTITVAGERGEA